MALLLRSLDTLATDTQIRADGLKDLAEQLSSYLKRPEQIPFDQLSSYSEVAATLPPLTKESLKKWFEFGKRIIFLFTSDCPERNPVLRKLGAYRTDAYYWKDVNTPKEKDVRKKTAKAKGTEESNIRDGIFQRLKRAYPVVMKVP